MIFDIIRRFEYETLHVQEGVFPIRYFNALVKYNESHGNQYFTVGHKKITFKNYVGVIQVGKLIIEILPKADRKEEDVNKWHNALVNILRACGLIKLHSLTNAQLKLNSGSLIDLYFESFLGEVEDINHKGLIKQYKKDCGNLSTLKGKLLFNRNLRENLIRKERFFTKHQVYNTDHLINRILKKALVILKNTTTNTHLQKRTSSLLLYFENISSIEVSIEDFLRIQFDWKSTHYRFALTLARLIILRYSPDLKAGMDNVLAILFDMNRLFEQFVFQQLKVAERTLSSGVLKINGQVLKKFWHGKILRPDIVIQYLDGNEWKNIIIDAKWKILDKPFPSDNDLKQMFAYNIHFGANRSLLLYPKGSLESTGFIQFENSELVNNLNHSCQVFFLEVFDTKGNIKPEIGKKLLESLFVLSENQIENS